ncbi:MAG: hypothetical protein ACK559_03195, partial [bacterium]
RRAGPPRGRGPRAAPLHGARRGGLPAGPAPPAERQARPRRAAGPRGPARGPVRGWVRAPPDGHGAGARRDLDGAAVPRPREPRGRLLRARR